MTTRVNILLVDDEPRNLDALEAILGSPEHALVRAGSAEEALLALLQAEFAAIVLDIRMPGTSGLELAALIKARRRTRDIPILFLTAHLIDEHDVLQGYGAGAVDYLSKPVNPEILRSKIAVFVDLYRKTRELADANAALQAEIAEHRLTQEALRLANDELESRVRDRTADLTAANRALSESEEQLRQALAAAEMGAWRVDLESGLVDGDASLKRILGLRPDEPLGHIHDRFRSLPPDDRRAVTETWARAVESRRAYAAEFRIRRPDGAVRWLREHGCFVHGAPGSPCITGVTLDITDRREAEEALKEHNRNLDAAVLERTTALERSHERLRQAERLATVGTLAAGLGHDMSNLLLPVRARLESLADADLPDDAAADIAAIREAAGYLQRLSAGLRLLSADPDRARESNAGTDLASWWRDVEGVFRAALPRGVRLGGAIPAGLPPVAVPASRLTQAVFNLVQNAGEAIAAAENPQGDMRISISAEPPPDPSTPGNGHVQLTIADTGPGMPADVAARCFEPYFSTKVRVLATGMGLPLVRAWVEAAGGNIDLATAPGQGASFILRLPPAAARAADRPQRRDSAGPRVALSLDDRRTAGFVASMLAAASASATTWDGDAVPDADVWIVGPAAAPERLDAFLNKDEHRRAVVLSDSPAPPGDRPRPENGDHPGGPTDRVRYIGAQPRTAELRGALLHVLRPASREPQAAPRDRS